jgi:hypothetical protein
MWEVRATLLRWVCGGGGGKKHNFVTMYSQPYSAELSHTSTTPYTSMACCLESPGKTSAFAKQFPCVARSSFWDGYYESEGVGVVRS